MTRLRDHHPTAAVLGEQALTGLASRPRSLPCKFFYDRRGAELFEEICRLEEYYLTRTELGILSDHLGDMAAQLGPDCLVLELGSGAGQKTRMLLDHLQTPVAYVPVDISKQQLIEVAEGLSRAYPGLEVLPVCADYTHELRLPEPRRPAARRMFFFPGSTIGNFHPQEAAAFLGRIGTLLGPRAALLVGVDLQKERATLEAAYNDSAGVTAEFNLNLLHRLNRECGGSFDVSGGFRHHAWYDEARGCIEMQLVSTRAQSARLLGQTLTFEAGEAIVTEHCYKYTLPGFARLAGQAGLAVSHVWCDAEERFSVQLLEPVR